MGEITSPRRKDDAGAVGVCPQKGVAVSQGLRYRTERGREAPLCEVFTAVLRPFPCVIVTPPSYSIEVN